MGERKKDSTAGGRIFKWKGKVDIEKKSGWGELLKG